MSKVKEQKESSQEYDQVRVASNIKVKIKRKKKRKDLQRLRYNVLKGRKKSRKKAPEFTKRSQQQMKRKMSCNRLLPEPNIGIYRNGAASKQLAQDKNHRLPLKNETIVSNDVMKLFNKEDYSQKKSETIPNANGNNSMETPITSRQNNAPAIEVIQSVGRWRWSPITCFEELCVKICLEVFMCVPIECFPDPLQKTEMLLLDLHMGQYDYSHEIESLLAFGENGEKMSASKQVLIDDKNGIIKMNNNEISGNEIKPKLKSNHSQIPRAGNQKNRVPNVTRGNEYNIPMKILPLTPIEREIMFTKSGYRLSPPSGRDLIEEKYVETPSVILRAIRKEDSHHKEKCNPIKTNCRGNGRSRSTKKTEIPGKSDLRGSMKFPSSGRQLNLDFGKVNNQQAYSRDKRNRRHDAGIDESEISSNAFLQNFKFLSFNDNQSKDTRGRSKKQGWGYSDDVQPNKYFAGNNESTSFDLPRPIPVYHHEGKRKKRDYTGGNLERKYDPVRRYSTTLGYRNNIDPLNSRMWITPEPQRNKVHKSHETAVSNNIALDPPNFFHRADNNYNLYLNEVFRVHEKSDYPLYRTVTFSDVNSRHYY